MKNLYTYMSNATKAGYAAKIAYNKLASAFAQRQTSYMRTDGKYHSELIVYDNKYINKEVKIFINNSPDYKVEELKYFYKITGDVYILNYYLNLSSPGKLIEDVINMSHKSFKIEKNKYIALDYMIQEDFLSNEKIELFNFDLKELLIETMIKELELEKEDIEIKFDNSVLEFG